MKKIIAASVAALLLAGPGHAEEKELPVEPYEITNENAGATPYNKASLYEAFNGKAGIARIVDDLVDGMASDPRTEKVVKASDFIRLRRTLKEQICYLTGGPCDYTGRTMTASHADHGITTLEFNAVVEILQQAMAAEGVPFRAQNKLLAKLAPMHRDIVTR